jgi:hypothetical protein
MAKHEPDGSIKLDISIPDGSTKLDFDVERNGRPPKAKHPPSRSDSIQDVTFGITTFERPKHLQNLVKSIRKFYPAAKILIGNNGNPIPKGLVKARIIQLPFDAGLSVTRNRLVDEAKTPYFLLLEDDFVFMGETRIDRMLDVLKADSEIGGVGGAIYNNGIRQHYAVEFRRFRRSLELRPSAGSVRVTPRGTPYQLCDMCFNFALFRREMLKRHKWPEHLKVGEHYAFFEGVKEAAEWRVANCDSVRINHDVANRSELYNKYRRRARSMYISHLNAVGLTSVKSHPDIKISDAPKTVGSLPNIVVLGVGHSGTSVLAKMLFVSGWDRKDADEEFGESIAIRDLNVKFLDTGVFDAQAAAKSLEGSQPWAIKDPRFVMTLSNWIAVFAGLTEPPLLLWLRREIGEIAKSYVRRNETLGGDIDRIVRKRLSMASALFDVWPWKKVVIDYEQIRAAVALFDVGRGSSHAFLSRFTHDSKTGSERS